jgi:hypothetical protein
VDVAPSSDSLSYVVRVLGDSFCRSPPLEPRQCHLHLPRTCAPHAVRTRMVASCAGDSEGGHAARARIRYPMSFLLFFQLSPHPFPSCPPSALGSFPPLPPSLNLIHRARTDVVLAGMAGSTRTVSPPCVPSSVRDVPHLGGKEGGACTRRNTLSRVCTSVLPSCTHMHTRPYPLPPSSLHPSHPSSPR